MIHNRRQYSTTTGWIAPCRRNHSYINPVMDAPSWTRRS